MSGRLTEEGYSRPGRIQGPVGSSGLLSPGLIDGERSSSRAKALPHPGVCMPVCSLAVWVRGGWVWVWVWVEVVQTSEDVDA